MPHASRDVQLPALPAAHARALSMLQWEEPDIHELTVVIEGDPALTGSVLRAANSAASAPRDPIATAGEAIVRLGLIQTRQIVTVAIAGSSFGELERAQIDTYELWRHLIACALLGDHITWGGERRTSAFTAGLLHDVGRLAMAHMDPDRYARAVVQARATGDLIEAEVNTFGYDHQEFGVRVAQQWKLPDEIVEAIGDHHYGNAGPISWVIEGARRIADSVGIGDGVLPATVPLARADEPAEDGPEPWLNPVERDPDDEAVLTSLGGEQSLFSQIDWFTSSVSGAARRGAA